MMEKKKKGSVNKLLLGAILGTAILGLGGYSISPKGKTLRQKLGKIFDSGQQFFSLGRKELRKKIKK